MKPIITSISLALAIVLSAGHVSAQTTAVTTAPDAVVTTSAPTDVDKDTAAKQQDNSSKCESCRWFEPTAASFSMRYRTTTDSGDVRNLNQGQQRIILGGKFKFDKEGRYSINAMASSGYYFNWAYAEFGWGAGGDESVRRGAPNMAPWIVRDQLPGAVDQAVSGYIAANYPNATPTEIAILRPTLINQFTPVVRQAVNDEVMNTLSTHSGSPKGWNLFLRQLYFRAEPIDGLEFSYGSLPINKGVNSEATAYDNDGYVSGGRVSVKRPKQFWFDEMSVTYAYLGDVYTPNFFRRTDRFKQSNYHQFLLGKKLFNGRVNASADYTFQDGTDTMREGVLINTKESKIFDSIRVEAYQRIGDNYVNNRTFKAGNGFYVEGEKTIAKKLNLAGGFANIDRNYSVYGEYSYVGLDYYGFSLNGDQTGLGRRFVGKANYKLTDDIGLSLLYSRAIGNDVEDMRYYWNKSHFNVAINYDILAGVKRLGWFR